MYEISTYLMQKTFISWDLNLIIEIGMYFGSFNSANHVLCLTFVVFTYNHWRGDKQWEAIKWWVLHWPETEKGNWEGEFSYYYAILPTIDTLYCLILMHFQNFLRNIMTFCMSSWQL